MGFRVQCAFSPLGRIAIAGEVAIARNTNLSALLVIILIVSGICSSGMCSNTSVEIIPSKGPSGSVLSNLKYVVVAV
jgi:hypothetical protein